MLKEEKILRNRLRETTSFSEFISIYNRFQKNDLDQIDYWDNLYQYILNNYDEFNSDFCERIIKKSLDNIQIVKEKFPTKSRFLVYEVKIMIELIKLNSLKYSSIYNDKLLANLINEALSINKNNSSAYIVRGNLFSANSQRSEAEIAYKQALEIEESRDKYDFMLLLDKAINNELDGNIEKAVNDYLLITHHEKDKSLLSIAYTKLISLYEKLNNDAERKYFKELLKSLEQ